MEELRDWDVDEDWHVITSDRRYWLPSTVLFLGLRFFCTDTGIQGLGGRLGDGSGAVHL